ncbi:MAG: thiamine phosphate synthase [Chlorobium sp.]|uniref:thiamine phosphate synthase n=1 Tax=Chlorobium sp. TaxID=1095 RepID=UPI002F42A848
MIPNHPFLCFVTDEILHPVEQVHRALGGGAAMIQLRHKSASGEQLYRWSIEIRDICRERHAIFMVNDRVDIAIAADADGVHLGQQDLPAAEARKLLGSSKILGVSVSSPQEAVDAENESADYVGFGHIFPTSSKEKHTVPTGPEAIGSIIQAVRIPVIAIGGINPENAHLPIAAGASGIAVITAISRAEDPEAAAGKLVSLLELNRLR